MPTVQRDCSVLVLGFCNSTTLMMFDHPMSCLTSRFRWLVEGWPFEILVSLTTRIAVHPGSHIPFPSPKAVEVTSSPACIGSRGSFVVMDTGYVVLSSMTRGRYCFFDVLSIPSGLHCAFKPKICNFTSLATVLCVSISAPSEVPLGRHINSWGTQ